MADQVRDQQVEGLLFVYRIAPGLRQLKDYQSQWLRSDLLAGISVAAVAIPTAIAYAQIAGLSPIIGLYAAILPLVAYAIFGTSRQLIVNPDAAACAMVAAICTPLAAGNPDVYLSLSIALAIIAGTMCIIGGVLRLGFVADFLSRPILVGLLNGVAISIFLGQFGKLLGVRIEAIGIFPKVVEILSKLNQTHLLTLAVSLATLLVMILITRYFRRAPGPLIAMGLAGAAAAWFGLEHRGVAVVGPLEQALPEIALPHFEPGLLGHFFVSASGLALVVFTKGMLSARVFATRNHQEVDADQECIAIGVSNVASGLSHGFAVSGTDSCTSVGEMMGGKTQVTGLVAAGVGALTILFFTRPLSYLPSGALGAVLVLAAFRLFNWRELRRLYEISRTEFALAIIATLAVVAAGVLPGMVFAIGLSVLRLLAMARRPNDGTLGRVEGLGGFHNVDDYKEAQTIEGLVLYRFESAIVFFNAPHFKQRALRAALAAPGLRWFVLDASAVPAMDTTGAEMLDELREELADRGVTLAICSPHRAVRVILERSGMLKRMGENRVFPTIKGAARAYYEATQDPEITKLGVRVARPEVLAAQAK